MVENLRKEILISTAQLSHPRTNPNSGQIIFFSLYLSKIRTFYENYNFARSSNISDDPQIQKT